MSDLHAWEFDLESYIHEGEPDRAKRADAWQTAIGLQAVDGLKTSEYLLDTARNHIEGAITIDEAQARIQSYYEERANRKDRVAEDTREGDVVSSRIARILGERAFTFSPAQLRSIHTTRFEGFLAMPGEYRPYNITKKEWVLKGDTVLYAPADSIEAALDYDFSRERTFSYRSLSKETSVHHIASFISGIWQVHPFCEGNTRTTAVFAIKYLASRGFEVDNEPFKKHSWYFRNALVRANYENLETGVHATGRYLDLFFDNLLLGTDHELRNRYLHLDWHEGTSDDLITAPQVTQQVTPQVTPQVESLVSELGEEELGLRELMDRLGLKDRNNFTKNYLAPALAAGLIERTIPDKPTSRLQRYRRRRGTS